VAATVLSRFYRRARKGIRGGALAIVFAMLLAARSTLRTLAELCAVPCRMPLALAFRRRRSLHNSPAPPYSANPSARTVANFASMTHPMTQAEGARPFTIRNATDTGRISVNGAPERWRFCRLLSSLISSTATIPARTTSRTSRCCRPSAEAQPGNVLNICTDAACTSKQPITGINQLRLPGGAVGDFFGPRTTVGIPFAAPPGSRVNS
jgi:hypothetical protein